MFTYYMILCNQRQKYYYVLYQTELNGNLVAAMGVEPIICRKYPCRDHFLNK